MPSSVEPKALVGLVLSCAWFFFGGGFLCGLSSGVGSPVRVLACEAVQVGSVCGQRGSILSCWQSFTYSQVTSVRSHLCNWFCSPAVYPSSFQESCQPFPPCGNAETVCVAFRSHCRTLARHGARPFKYFPLKSNLFPEGWGGLQNSEQNKDKNKNTNHL